MRVLKLLCKASFLLLFVSLAFPLTSKAQQCSETPSLQFGTVSAVPATANACLTIDANNPCYGCQGPTSQQNGDLAFTVSWPNSLNCCTSVSIPVSFNPNSAGSYSTTVSATYWSQTAAKYTTYTITLSGAYSPTTGLISPKYQILSVMYAPPGSGSNVNYGTSTNLGTSSSINNSFSTSTSVSVTVGFSAKGIFGIAEATGGVSSTASTTDTHQQSSSSSVAFNKITTDNEIVKGPIAAGLDHNFDVVKIWLNPAALFTLPTSSSVQLSDYYFDESDPCNCMDTVELTIGQLKNPALITDQNQLNQLARNWAPNLADGTSPGLTAADLLAIAAADPYSNPSYNPTFTQYPDGTCSSDGRFCLSDNADIQYASPQQGGQGTTTSYSQSYTTTATEGKGATDTHQTGFSTDAFESGAFSVGWSHDLKTSNTLTWVNSWSTQTSQTNSQSVSTTITPPTFSDNYTGPTEFLVYQDNVYGTFMFLPVNFPGFILSASPASQTTTTGQKASFTVSTSSEDGGTGTVNLAVSSGLPSGASASFNPASVSVGGSSALTISTTSTTPVGTYTLTITGTVGSNLAHAVQVTLVVNAPAPDFSISASPSSQTVTIGGSTTYSVSTTALNGFTGTITPTVTGLPTGASGSFSPTSITGTGSSTLTVKTTTSTPSGGYTLTITGTSGSLKHSATVTLVVAASHQITRVQVANPAYVHGTSLTATLSTEKAGDFLIAATAYQLPGTTVTLTDTLGNTWTRLTAYNNSKCGTTDGNYSGVQLWFAQNIKAGANSVKMTVNATTYIWLGVVEYSGIKTSGALAASNGFVATASSSSLSAGNVTATGPNNLIFGFFHNEHQNTNMNAGAGYVDIANSGLTSMIEDKISAAAGTYNPSATYTNGSDACGVAADAAFISQ